MMPELTEQSIWAFVVVALSPVLGLVMWRWAKPQKDKIEDSNSLATSIQAIGDAAVKVVGVVGSVIWDVVTGCATEVQRPVTIPKVRPFIMPCDPWPNGLVGWVVMRSQVGGSHDSLELALTHLLVFHATSPVPLL